MAVPLDLVVSPAGAEQERSDRRAHHRLALAELPWFHEIRLKYGPRAVLINLSVGGAQLEAADARLMPGSTVMLEIAGRREESVIPSRVVRCQMVGLSPRPIYRAALEFKQTLTLPETRPPRGIEGNPLQEHGRLMLALQRLDAKLGLASDGGFYAPQMTQDMTAVLAMINTPAARRAGRRFVRELATLFSIVTRGVEEDTPDDVLAQRLVERLRLAIPTRSVRVTDTLAVPHGDAVYFDVPYSGAGPASKLLVEFRRDFRFEEWQFQYLKAAAHFFAFVREIAARRAARQVWQAAQEADDPVGTGDAGSPVSRIIVRYRDGRPLKGFAREFVPSSGVAEIWSSPDPLASTRMTVPLAQLKALSIVQVFDGEASGSVARSAVTHARGRKVVVTFDDGEELTGVTVDYHSDAVGFFVLPLDGQNNHSRVFVVSKAIRKVRFP